jgi:uncharacterized C2H2 Zn-finger protein
MVVKTPKKNPKKYECKSCNFISSNKKDYSRHLNTAKHSMIVNDSKNPKIPFSKKMGTNSCVINNNEGYICTLCGKSYKYDSGYYRHKKTCTINNQPLQNNNNSIMQLIKQNQEFKELIIELSKKDTTTNNNNNTTNNNNQKFNLNVFLNTTCKDAMNMSEFIENMEVQFEDIENIGRDGYVTGMTNMIMSRIKNLEVTKRPMHCTDLKRETIYIKDNNVWEKDSDNTKLHNMIQCIAHKNYAILPAWREKNPDCLNSDTQKFDFCIKMMTNLLGDTGEGQIKLDNKVIRNITKHINVDKSTNMLTK